MTQHHPDHNILTEFVAGSLSPAEAIAVRAHLHYCHQCRQAAHELEALGGSLLEALPPQALSAGCFDDLMAAIDAEESPTPAQVPAASCADETHLEHSRLPLVLTQIMQASPVKWRNTNRKIKTATLETGHRDYEVSLQRIKAGAKIPEHDHKGIELTVVLEGSFSDEKGMYQAGDFVLKMPGDIHKPVAACHQDCLCLTVQSAPVKLTGFMGRIINPFLKIKTA